MSTNASQAGATPADGAGATPAQAGTQGGPEGATPPQGQATTSTQPSAQTPPDDQSLGDAGRRALDAEREARRTAERKATDLERRLTELEESGKSEQEKAIAKARREGATEARTQADARIRRAEVRSALVAAGIVQSELELAAQASDFASLELNDDLEVQGLEEAVKGFKAAHPALFAATTPQGSADGGVRGGTSGLPTFKRSQLRDPAFYEAHQAEILAAARDGRISED